MKSIALCGILFLSMAAPAWAAGPASWEDDQIELLVMAGLADGSLTHGSSLTNLLAAGPHTIRVDANGRLEWKYQEDDPWVQVDGSAINPTAADRDRLAAWSAVPWIASSLPRYARSQLSERHVNRSVKLALSPEASPALKYLALANAGGRMYVIEKVGKMSFNGQIKLYYHGGDAAGALAEMERLKIQWALKIAAGVPVDLGGAASLHALASEDKPGRRLVLATAYVRDGGKPRMLWADFQTDSLSERSGDERRRDVVAWRMDEFGRGPIPTGGDDAMVYTCAFGIYENVIVIGRINHRQSIDLAAISMSLEGVIESLAKTGVVVVLSRPGSPLLGIAGR